MRIRCAGKALLPLLLVIGCAAEAHSGPGPAVPISAKRGRASHATAAGRAAAAKGHPGWYPDANNGGRIPGGASCISWLHRLGIQFSQLDRKPGIDTPVEVTGPIGGIRYSGGGKSSVVIDCRLVLALDWSSRPLRALGVTAIEHFGAYSVRYTRSGRLSLHARGLALDIGALRIGDTWHRVKAEYKRGLGAKCSGNAPVLNAVSCQLRALKLYREMITPDDDRDHRDHFHVALAPRRG